MIELNFRKESYSSLSLFKNCPYQYKLKYIDGNYSNVSTLALELGTLLHFILEQKMKPCNTAKELLNQKQLQDILYNGDIQNKIIGLNELKNKYFEDYLTAGRKSNITYEDKLNKVFIPRIKNTENVNGLYKEENEWNVLAVEFPFEFNYDKDIVISGKIDRIDINKNGDFRVVDYKSSDSVFDDKELSSALQMYIYGLAINNLFNKFPVEYLYDFILLGDTALALTDLKYKTKMAKKLNSLIDSLKTGYTTKEFKPKPSPLCYWCNYNCQGLTKDEKNKNLCEFYSLWTPTDKTFSVNKTWETGSINSKPKPKEFIW